MKYTQKTKYFIYGVIATAVLVPLGTYAVKTIPVTFSEGDVLSASVLNSLMDRINDVQSGYSSADELNGTWVCTTNDITDYTPTDCTSGKPNTKQSTIAFNSSTKTFTDTTGITTGGSVFYCGGLGQNGIRNTANYEVKSNHIWFWFLGTGLGSNALMPITKVTPTQFQIKFGGQSVIDCAKNNQAPAPADALSATVSGTSVALAWTDQSDDETGFKVQYKTSAKGSWTTATTTAADATSYTISGLTAATYWIRVVAKNANGDAMSSSETQAVIP